MWLIIVILCIILGILDHFSAMDENSKSRFVLDVWRHSANYFITAILGYFIITIRWPLIKQGSNLDTSDFIVGITFIIGIFGWWPYIIKNFTEGIDTIISKVFKK